LLVFDKDRQLTALSVSIRSPEKYVVGISFIPMEIGEIQIIGIQFKYFQHANLFAPFRDYLIIFRIYATEPNLAVTVTSFKPTIFVGETCLIELHVRNGFKPRRDRPHFSRDWSESMVTIAGTLNKA
jgi:hypothetical protein